MAIKPDHLKKLNRKHFGFLLLGLLLGLFLWAGPSTYQTKDQPVKQKITHQEIYLFNKIRLYRVSKKVSTFNRDGQLIKKDFYSGGEVDSRYHYYYTEFDSLKKRVWLTGEALTPQSLTIYQYDSLNRLKEETKLSIKGNDTLLNELIRYKYDSSGRQYFFQSKSFTSSDTEVNIIIDYYDSSGKRTKKVHRAYMGHDTSEYVTRYRYNDKGWKVRKTGGMVGDTVVYEYNDEGLKTREISISGNYVSGINQYRYNEAGKATQIILNKGNNQDFFRKFYDSLNRIVLEFRYQGAIPFISNVIKYRYKYH